MNLEFKLIIKKDKKYYSLENFDEKSIWIGNEEGEGGTFRPDEFFELIDKFFKENY